MAARSSDRQGINRLAGVKSRARRSSVVGRSRWRWPPGARGPAGLPFFPGHLEPLGDWGSFKRCRERSAGAQTRTGRGLRWETRVRLRMLEQGPNVSGLLEPDWVECRPLGASGSMTPWWPPSRGMGISPRGFVMCLDLLTSVLMKMREGLRFGAAGRRHQLAAERFAFQGRLKPIATVNVLKTRC